MKNRSDLLNRIKYNEYPEKFYTLETRDEGNFVRHGGVNLHFDSLKEANEFEDSLSNTYMIYFNDKEKGDYDDKELKQALIDAGYKVNPEYSYKIDGSGVEPGPIKGTGMVLLVIAEYKK